MNPSEFARKFAKITPDVIRKIGVESVHENSDVVISDAIVSNIEGLTFAGNSISKNPPFKDWEESGQFHGNLRFAGKEDIDFTSNGDGAEAIFNTFPEVDTIAPTAKILSNEAKTDLKKSMIKKVKALWQQAN